MKSAAVDPMSARPRERGDRAERTERLLTELDGVGPRDTIRQDELIAELIEVNMPVARSIATRYRHRGIADEDLEQVAYVALVRVARHYDHSSGYGFLAYAVPSIRGEVRRHFRDLGWMVRPPRRVQENQARISALESGLTTRLGRPPTTAELARELGEDEHDVAEAQAANGCFRPSSLDQPVHDQQSRSIVDQLGYDEAGLEAVEARVVLGPCVRRLSDRDRRILEMRFIEDCTQQRIADEIGVTQMQVSRLLSGLMRRLRAELEGPAPVGVSACGVGAGDAGSEV